MPPDPLEPVLRLRQRAVEDARRALASSLAAAATAEAACRDAEAAIRRETELASDPDGDDALVEAFAAWLPGARRRATQARQWLERQEAEVARRRAELTACRTALEAVTQLLAERRTRLAQAAARREQAALDEAVQRRPA